MRFPIPMKNTCLLLLSFVIVCLHEQGKGFVANAADRQEPQAIVMHAAGAVTLRVPAKWEIAELPVRREVRLLMTPERQLEERDRRAGIWLCFHYRQVVPSGLDELTAFAKRRHLEMEPGAVHQTSAFRAIDGHEAIELTFQAEEGWRGRYLAIVLPWGYCELQAEAGTTRWETFQPVFERVISSLRFRPPREPRSEPIPETRDAVAILGTWKSYRGRFRLHPDGRVELVTDQPSSALGIGEAGVGETGALTDARRAREVSVISGRLRAQGDILFIEWDDGSKLNFRWRHERDRLLLTDHHGRTTQLRRILE